MLKHALMDITKEVVGLSQGVPMIMMMVVMKMMVVVCDYLGEKRNSRFLRFESSRGIKHVV